MSLLLENWNWMNMLKMDVIFKYPSMKGAMKIATSITVKSDQCRLPSELRKALRSREILIPVTPSRTQCVLSSWQRSCCAIPISVLLSPLLSFYCSTWVTFRRRRRANYASRPQTNISWRPVMTLTNVWAVCAIRGSRDRAQSRFPWSHPSTIRHFVYRVAQKFQENVIRTAVSALLVAPTEVKKRINGCMRFTVVRKQ